MAMSYKILSVMGIDIELHFLFLVFMLAFAFVDVSVAIMLLIVFFFVTVHELCHSYVALRNNIKVKKIVLLPIGGMAMMDVSDIKPLVEIKMALAGPLFNIAVSVITLALLNVLGIDISTGFAALATGTPLPLLDAFLIYVFYANAVLGIFNLLIPAFPLDGGRILRAALALRMPYMQATEAARLVSLSIAAVMFVMGMLFNWWLVIIALFIVVGATSEYQMLAMRTTLKGLRNSSALSKDFVSASASESVLAVTRKMVLKNHGSAVVLNGGVKILQLDSFARVSRAKWGSAKVGALARKVAPVQLRGSLEKTFSRMLSENLGLVPVVDGKRFVGVIYRTEIERLSRILEVVGRPSS